MKFFVFIYFSILLFSTKIWSENIAIHNSQEYQNLINRNDKENINELLIQWKNQGDMTFDLSSLKNLNSLILEKSTGFEHITIKGGETLRTVMVRHNSKAGDIGFINLKAEKMVIQNNKELRDIWITEGENKISSFALENNSGFQDFKYNSSEPLSDIMISDNASFRNMIITGYPKINTCTLEKNKGFTNITFFAHEVKNLNVTKNSEYNAVEIKS